MEKRVYKEAPLKIAVRVVAGIIGFFLLMLLLFTYVIPTRPSNPGENVGGLIGFGAAFGVMLSTLLVAWLAIKKRAVTIDFTGAEVVAKRPFGRAASERFLWQNVSETFISSETYTIRNSTQTNYKLGVSLNDGRVVYLLDKTYLDLKLRNLIRDVNRATGERLGYVWEECRADETRPILEAVPPFCKIATSEAARRNFATNALISPASVISRTVENPAAPKILTKKQMRQDWLFGLCFALALWAITAGLVGWDYYSQKQSWDRMSTSRYDFNAGKSVSAPKPPFDYRFGDSGLLPVIIIVGAVGGLMFAGAVYSLSKWRQVVETPEMLVEDARREKIENSPGVKEVERRVWRGMGFRVLVFAPVIVMLFIKPHYSIYFSYLIVAAVAIGIHAYISVRR